jgi:hypothetical protein
MTCVSVACIECLNFERHIKCSDSRSLGAPEEGTHAILRYQNASLEHGSGSSSDTVGNNPSSTHDDASKKSFSHCEEETIAGF